MYFLMSNFGEWLRDELAQHGISQTELAYKIGVTPAQVSRIISGERSTSNEVLVNIAHILKLPPEQVYRAAGILPPESEINELVEQIVHETTDMPEQDQQEVLAFIRMKNNLRAQRKKK